MTQVAIIGVGLIGGSLGLALRKDKRFSVSGFSPSSKTRSAAKRKGAVGKTFSTSAEAVKEADVVVLCVPVQKTEAVLKNIAPHLKAGAVVTDAGSVKEPVLRAARKSLRKRKDVFFVGGHPLAGSEKTGVQHASGSLFKKAPFVLVKDGSKAKAANTVARLWRAAGARVFVMSAKKHDKILAATSHLPHLIAFCLFSRVAGPPMRADRFSGGAFRDFTRIAASDPILWSGIFSSNRKAIIRELSLLSKDARRLALKNPSRMKTLLSAISRAKKRAA